MCSSDFPHGDPLRKRTTSVAGATRATCRSESRKRSSAKTPNASFAFSETANHWLNVKGKDSTPWSRPKRSAFLQDRFGVDGDLNHVADDDPTPV